MNFEELIRIEENSTQIELRYRGTPSEGMLAWLDSTEVKKWWKAESVIIEPFHGGMFYVAWGENEGSTQYAIYGVMDKVDTDLNVIEVTKIMFISPNGKMGHLHMHISFKSVNADESIMYARHSHKYTGQALNTYLAAVKAGYPKTCALLKKYLEKDKVGMPAEQNGI